MQKEASDETRAHGRGCQWGGVYSTHTTPLKGIRGSVQSSGYGRVCPSRQSVPVCLTIADHQNLEYGKDVLQTDSREDPHTVAVPMSFSSNRGNQRNYGCPIYHDKVQEVSNEETLTHRKNQVNATYRAPLIRKK